MCTPHLRWGSMALAAACALTLPACQPPAAANAAEKKTNARPALETVPGKYLADTAVARNEFPGKMRSSEVVMRGLFPRPKPGETDQYDTLEALKGFHATRLEWTYSLTPEFVQKVRDMGITVSGVTNTATGRGIDRDNPDWLKDYAILTLDGTPTTGTWMRKWETPGVWFCVNNERARHACLEDLKYQIDMGLTDIQRDDGAANSTAVKWGACFCEFCVRDFRAYLKENLAPEKLQELEVANVDTFNYREHLIAKGAPSGDEFQTYQGGELQRHFAEFQTASTVKFHEWWHEEINKYAGRYVPISANNVGRDFSAYNQPFDFWIGELSITNASAEFLYHLSRKVTSMGKGQTLTMPLEHHDEVTPHWLRTIRQSLGTIYAVGMHMEAPWDTYLPTPKALRFFGEYKDSADLFAMVRASADLLDGYEDAAATGGMVKDPRWVGGERPVSLLEEFGQVSAFARAKPGDHTAPVVVHLIDWSDTSKPFQLSLRGELLFAGKPFRAELITPVPYEQAAHDQAFASKDYRGLVLTRELGSGNLALLEIPALSPWGLLKLTPINDPEGDLAATVWPPAVVVESSLEGLTRVNLTSATAGASIRYTLDGSTPTEESALYSGPVTLPREEATLRTRAFVPGAASQESKFALSPGSLQVQPQLLKNPDFTDNAADWKPIVFQEARLGTEFTVSTSPFPEAPGGPSARMSITKSAAATPYHIRLVQPLEVPAGAKLILSGKLVSDKSGTIRIGVQGEHPPHKVLCMDTLPIEAGEVQEFSMGSHNGADSLEALVQFDLGLMPPGTNLWLTEPKLSLVTTTAAE